MKNTIEKNKYGQVDIRNGIPDELIHIDKKRVSLIAKKLNIEFAPAITGKGGIGKRFHVKISGIVILKKDEEKFVEYLKLKK